MPYRRPSVSRVFLAAAACVGLLGVASGAERAPVSFKVTYTPQVRRGPISARVFVMLGPPSISDADLRQAPNWLQPSPMFAVEARDWKAGEPLRFDDKAKAYPGPVSALAPGEYAGLAVIRLNPDTHALGTGEGNAVGPLVRFKVEPKNGGTFEFNVDRIVPDRPFVETDRIKLVDIPSPILSAFYGRPIRHRAAVLLPQGDRSTPRPVLYIIPGFGGDHHRAQNFLKEPRFQFGTETIRVILDPDCGTGHHVFADSACNGPRGRALVQELIPHIETRFSVIAERGARLLNGHSSGGWSSLWLQVNYPDVFSGTWSTSPDPVDFRDFSAIDIYAPHQNVYRDCEGHRRPIVRMESRPVVFLDDFSRLEGVYGDGGQLHSFEAVFSPLGRDGRPRLLWNRKTGAVDPAVAKAWESYDIRLLLERDWPTLGPKLAGKLHVITGSLDNFYLDGAVRLLKKSLRSLGSDAVVEVIPGRDHRNLLDAELADRIEREMNAALSQRLGEQFKVRSQPFQPRTPVRLADPQPLDE